MCSFQVIQSVVFVLLNSEVVVSVLGLVARQQELVLKDSELVATVSHFF